MAWTDYPGIRQLRDLSNRLRAAFVREVPERIARCEFDCDKADCPPDAIRDCERRADYELAERNAREHPAPLADEDVPHGRGD